MDDNKRERILQLLFKAVAQEMPKATVSRHRPSLPSIRQERGDCLT